MIVLNGSVESSGVLWGHKDKLDVESNGVEI